MASSSSWFPRSPSTKQDYELPRWHTPAHMTASLIPPPIVQSTYATSPKASPILPVKSVILEKPAATISQESELQADLQFLLDAQAEGLVRGFEGGYDDTSSQGSTTPTARSARGQSLYANRPLRRRLGLRSARRGIYNCMMTLSGIKQEELVLVDASLWEKEASLEQIGAWEKKRAGLEEASTSINNEDETVRVQRLKHEADLVQEEINKTELHLMELKTKHRRALKQAAAIENSVQAKLASYTASLSMLDKDINTFLSRRPTEDPTATTVVMNGKQSVWQLPNDRRTLELAKEQFRSDQEDMQSQRKVVQVEQDALDEGAAIWKDVIEHVTSFEKRLRLETSQLGASMTDSTGAWDDTPQASPKERLSGLYEQLIAVITHLQQQLHMSEERNWRLLIAAIGAELDALQRGQQILGDMINKVSKTDSPLFDDTKEQHHVPPAKAAVPTARPTSKGRSDTDDEPDPELLFSVQDDDTDG